MGTSWRLVYALSTLVCACAGQAALAARRDDGCGIARETEGHALHVYLGVDRGGRRASLCAGQDLTGADTLWISVEVATDAYVRTIFVTPDGETGELLREDANGLTRVARFQAPRGLMTRSTGDAQFVVVVARNRLHESDPTMAAMLDVIRETGVLVDHEGRLTPPMRAVEGNPEEILLNLGTDSLYADFDDNGVAVLTLTLHSTP